MPVTKNGADTWDYVCPQCGFESTRWATKALATDRGNQHANEHETGELMQDIAEFTSERTR